MGKSQFIIQKEWSTFGIRCLQNVVFRNYIGVFNITNTYWDHKPQFRTKNSNTFCAIKLKALFQNFPNHTHRKFCRNMDAALIS